MESNNQSRAPEKAELAAGAVVSLFVNGKRLGKEILERRSEHLLLGALEESWAPPFHHGLPGADPARSANPLRGATL